MLNFQNAIRILLFWAFTMTAVVAWAQDEDESKGKLGEAATAMRNRQYLQAEQIYRSMLKEAPEDISVKQLLCHALIYEKKFFEADSILRKLTEEDSNNAGTYWYRGISSERQNQDSMAVIYFKTYLVKTEKMATQKPKGWLLIGSAYRRMMHSHGINQAQFDDMLYHYKKYLELNPQDPFAGELNKFIEAVKPKRPDEKGSLVWDETN